MIRIAFVINTIATPGAGTEKQLLLLMKHLDRSQFQPHLVCLQDSEWLKGQSFDFPVIKYNALSVTSFPFWTGVRRFAAWCKEQEIDIVQTHFFDATLFGTVGAHFAERPLVVSTRRNIGNWHNWLSVGVTRFLRKWTTHYLANSQAAVEKTVEVELVQPDRIDVIYNALDLPAYSCINKTLRDQKRWSWGFSESDIVIGIIANLRDVKNIESLVRVTARLLPEFPALKVVSIGEGPRRPAIEKLIKDLKVERQFHIMGSDTDVIPALAAFDIATLTSRFESFSNSLIEYMAAGLPIVASNVGGNGEAIENGVSGILYNVEKDEELESSLRRLLTDRDFARKLGDNARRKACARYSLEACIQGHEKYYRNLLQFHARK